MKQFFTFIIILILGINTSFSQCNRAAPFQDGPFGDYTINGTATLSFLLNGTKSLNFDSNFSTTSGPDLHVYLSKSTSVSTPGGNLTTPNTIDLGLLQSASGSQSYDLTNHSPSVSLDDYDYVIIHCKAYDHYWGSGTLGANQGTDCTSLLSIEDIQQHQTKIFPTVIQNNELIIEIISTENSFLNILSITGQKIRNSVILKDPRTQINTSFLEKGIYLIQVINQGKTFTKKIIIP